VGPDDAGQGEQGRQHAVAEQRSGGLHAVRTLIVSILSGAPVCLSSCAAVRLPASAAERRLVYADSRTGEPVQAALRRMSAGSLEVDDGRGTRRARERQDVSMSF